MKWFHHECTAKHDTRLQVIGRRHGAAGIGIYWGLMEELGEHSDTFQLKITELPAGSARGGSLRSLEPVVLQNIPKIPAGLLARIMFVSTGKLLAVIESAVAEGLFDAEKWTNDAILYSPQFELRADEYTRRQRRNAESLRTKSEQCAEKVPSEQNRREKEKNRTDKSAEVIDISTSVVDISTLKIQIHRKLTEWNAEYPGMIFWNPTDDDVGALLRGIGSNDQINLCREASALIGKNISFHALALRAVDLMLRTALKNRVTNPPGFIRTSLFGNGDGGLPWVLRDLSRNPAGVVP